MCAEQGITFLTLNSRLAIRAGRRQLVQGFTDPQIAVIVTWPLESPYNTVSGPEEQSMTGPISEHLETVTLTETKPVLRACASKVERLAPLFHSLTHG